MKRRFIAIVVCLVLLLSQSVFVTADEVVEETITDIYVGSTLVLQNTAEPVVIGLAKGTPYAEINYRLTLTWSQPSQKAEQKGNCYVWNTTSLRYELKGAGQTTIDNSPIEIPLTVTNYSNAAVKYEVKFQNVKNADSQAVYVSSYETTYGTGELDYGSLASAEGGLGIPTVLNAPDSGDGKHGEVTTEKDTLELHLMADDSFEESELDEEYFVELGYIQLTVHNNNG